MRYKHDGRVSDMDVLVFECVEGFILAIVKDRSNYHYAIDLETGKRYFDGRIPSYSGMYFPTQFEIDAITLMYETFSIRRKEYQYQKKLHKMNYFSYLIATMLIVIVGFGGGIAVYNLFGGIIALVIYYAIIVGVSIFLYRYYQEKNRCPNQKKK